MPSSSAAVNGKSKTRRRSEILNELAPAHSPRVIILRDYERTEPTGSQESTAFVDRGSDMSDIVTGSDRHMEKPQLGSCPTERLCF